MINCISSSFRVLVILFGIMLMQGCSSAPQYIEAKRNCEYLVGYGEGGRAQLSVKAPVTEHWSIFHMVLAGECRTSGEVI